MAFATVGRVWFVAAFSYQLRQGCGIDAARSAHHDRQAVLFGGRAQRPGRDAELGRGFVDREQSRHRLSVFRLIESRQLRLDVPGVLVLEKIAEP